MSKQEALPASPGQHWELSINLRTRADEHEKTAITLALGLVGGNVRQAADILAVPYRTLDRKLREGKFRDLRKLTSKKLGRPKVR